MDFIQKFVNYFRKHRKPAESGTLIALSHAVLIGTPDGHAIVITPRMARELASVLPNMANQAEGKLPTAV